MDALIKEYLEHTEKMMIELDYFNVDGTTCTGKFYDGWGYRHGFNFNVWDLLLFIAYQRK